jgi:hypothetical protein
MSPGGFWYKGVKSLTLVAFPESAKMRLLLVRSDDVDKMGAIQHILDSSYQRSGLLFEYLGECGTEAKVLLQLTAVTSDMI